MGLSGNLRGLKPHIFNPLYAALKRRSSTVAYTVTRTQTPGIGGGDSLPQRLKPFTFWHV